MFPAVLPVYNRAELCFERGEGAYLYSDSGKRYLDFASGIAVNSLGHCHPHLVKALKEQGEKLWHVSNLFSTAPLKRLSERLVAASFADSVFFCNSGAEALEAGIKLCRKYHDETGNPDRYRIITFEGAFHGRTLATIAATGTEKTLKGFDPVVDGFDKIPPENLAALEKAITPETGAILIEPVQGEGGVRVISEGYMRELRRIANERGLLLFLDEVQSGMGRTGRLFAHEWSGVTPDILATAKGIGGGFPLGACLATEKVAKTLTQGSHGSTFGGNPLATAVGGAVLDVILEKGFLDKVAESGAKLKAGLDELARKYPGAIVESRGRGLLLGFKSAIPNADMVVRLRDLGLLVPAAGDNVVRVLPPLNITAQEIAEGLGIIEQACKELAA